MFALPARRRPANTLRGLLATVVVTDIAICLLLAVAFSLTSSETGAVYSAGRYGTVLARP
jgi:Kef-type K+ transport system membrane component KefB